LNDPARTFRALAAMDLFARTGYQMGKSPVLPMFAVAVGAGEAELGLAASASVMTGMVLKPWIGAASDRYGRRPLLILGSLLFALVPVAYLLIQNVWQLVGLRVVHGLSTALYGPVMAALIADLYRDRGQGCRRYGLYDTFRSVGYVTGPFFGGLALSWLSDPRRIYWVVGGFGLAALAPALFVGSGGGSRTATDGDGRARGPLSKAVKHFVRAVAGDAGLRRVIGLELTGNLLTRWAKVFWVVHVADRFGEVFIGTVISLIFGASIACKSLAGWLGGRFGPVPVLTAGAVLTAAGMTGLFLTAHPAGAVGFALLAGIGDGLIMPGVMALVAYGAAEGHRGAAMGVLGACRNVGKAMGPLLGGLLAAAVGTAPTVLCGAGALVFLAIRLWGGANAADTTAGSPSSR
jgi:MFS family permease